MIECAVILLSYNRPRMLAEALDTIPRGVELVVTDDGSDFDAVAAVRNVFPQAKAVEAPPLDTAARLVTPRLGSLINRALALVEAPWVTYLCDDDLWAPGWLDAVDTFFRAHPEHHWVRGQWRQFTDGQPRGADVCPLDPRGMTTGNFAHRMACYRVEGLRWNEASVACHDDMMLWDAERIGHNMHAVPDCGALAGWRRLHAHNALNYCAGAAYAPHAEALFAGRWLE